MGVWLVGVDTGGTFTDLIAVEQNTGELRRAKVPSVSSDPSAAVLDAMDKLFAEGIDPADISLFVHGTTVATNALLEGKGVRTGLLITRGFRAVYEARGWSQPRGSDLLDTFYQKPPLLASQWLTEEVRERLDYRGEVVTALDEAGLRDSVHRLKAKGVEALAVCFLFSFLNPAHERRAAEIVAEIAPECRISLSSNVLPVIREYPRLSTTVIDAYVGPTIADYLMRLERRLIERGLKTPQLFLMQSNGGLMRISLGARHPNQTLLSGPAAGVIAGAELARVTRRRHVITFDMGGTSTDISVIVDGRLLETTQGQIAGQDIGTPMLRVRTLGAGGGTIAWIGKDGLLKVGPRSAGSVPGPACYGRGGEEPTVTDANVALGALGADTVLAGSLRLDAARAARAIESVAKPLGLDVLQGAAGILRIVNTQMAVDLRLALQEQGQDPRKFALVAFGGAGPLHAAALARSVGIPTVLVPPYPGLNCAIGMLQTSVRHSYLKSEVGVLSRFPTQRMNDLFRDLRQQALAEASEEGFAHDAVKLTRLLDLRYPHQGYTLPVACPAEIADEDKPRLKQAFDDVHLQVYGQSAPKEDADIVTFRLQAEIEVPRLELPKLARGDGRAERALKGERPLFDIDANRFVGAKVYDRQKLMAGDGIPGPAIIDQFDATTVVLGGQIATVDGTATLIIETGEQP
ncbi:MAG TPA: hydantoinase/oxoprolinase family protein [Xanthobacteraceae bacterium]|nr:hydantoinase/oxoprolinase family protein [Xanthobacteraceae bacterium]